MKKINLILAILVLVSSISFSQIPKSINDPEITANEIQDHINYLASDKLEGRFSGSEGEKLASEYIQKEFKNYGLKPLFGDSYFQEFLITTGIDLGNNNSATFKIGNENSNLKLKEDFIPMSFSDNLNIKGELVFAGYGISAADLNYDDYKNIDIKNKIAIVLRHHPEIDNPHSEFDQYSDFRYKANTAKEKGAAGIIFIDGYFPSNEENALIDLKYDRAPAIDGISAINVKREIVEKLLKDLKDKNLKVIQEEINKTKSPNSFIVENSEAIISTDIKMIEKKARNVGAVLEGSDPNLKNEYLVIGAHYDHLGFGETGSLYRGKDKQIHNGADDNASGTTGVLELAEKFSSIKNNKRSIIFITFSGEELGLLGSNHFVNNSSIPLEKMKTMINLDMIGRMNDENSLTIYGAATSTIWKDLLNKTNSNFNFNISYNDEGFGPSDHSSFYGKQIPVLFFFTGVHTDYHRPSDDAETINAKKQEQVVKFVYEIANEIVNKDKSPDYVNVPRKDTGGAMRFKVYVGTIPDYSSQAEGFKITGVSEGSPAQKAGLQANDVIVEFGGKPVKNIYDYMYAMNEFAPGDLVEVVVLRNGEKKNLKVELAAK